MKGVLTKGLLSGLVLAATSVCAAINPSDLVKVNDSNNAQCVEYFQYKNAMYCSTKALSSQTVDPAIRDYEKQTLIFDDRAWQPAWGKKSKSMIMVEYVPMGGDINHWHELVTTQFFPGIQNETTPKNFANIILKGITDSGFKPTVTFIKDTPDQVVFEFRIEHPANQIQDELQIITKGKDGFYVVHYVIKEMDMGKARRELWLKNLLGSGIK